MPTGHSGPGAARATERPRNILSPFAAGCEITSSLLWQRRPFLVQDTFSMTVRCYDCTP